MRGLICRVIGHIWRHATLKHLEGRPEFRICERCKMLQERVNSTWMNQAS